MGEFEREMARQQREAAAYAKEMVKREEQQRALGEVAAFERQVDLLRWVHRDCGPTYDWNAIQHQALPPEPQYAQSFEHAAVIAADSYKPSIVERMFGGETKRRTEYAQAIVDAKRQDAAAFEVAKMEHQQRVAVIQWEKQLAASIIAGDLAAYRAAIKRFRPTGIGNLLYGSEIAVRVDVPREDVAVVWCTVPADAVPTEEKKVTAAGKVTTKAMAASQWNDIYKDYVCGVALRMAREMFALLPLPRVIINIGRSGIDTSTGHQAFWTLLAVSIPRETLGGLRFDRLDAFDSMKNFDKRMNFKKTTGFEVLEPMNENESFISTGKRR